MKDKGLVLVIEKASAYSRRKLLVEIRKLEAVVKQQPFDKLAAELQDVLLHGWNAAQKEAIDNVIRALKGDNDFTDSDLKDMLSKLRPILGDKFAGDVAAAIAEIELSAYGVGLSGSVKLQPSFNVIDRKAIDFLKQHNIYWVKHFFDEQLASRVTELGTKVIEEGMSREAAGKIFEEEFAKKYEAYSWRYWQGFANHVVTRSREFGNTERYVRANIEYLQVKAVVDHRTTEICRHMHNRVISVKKAVELRDSLIAAETPEEVKEIAPWMKPDKLAAKPSSSLPTGMSLPPYHFNCRSRTVKASETAIEEQKVYEKNVKQLHKDSDYKKNYEDYRKLGEEAPVDRRLRFDENVVRWMKDQELAPSLKGNLSPYKKAFKEVLETAGKKAS